MLGPRCPNSFIKFSAVRPTRLVSISRLYSILHTPSVETIQVTCGSSGHVIVKIHNNHHPCCPTAPLIIHIPPLSLSSSTVPITTPKEYPVPTALLALNIPIIQITPRWSPPAHRFPTPIHDLLHAYTHILTYILPPPPPTLSFRPRPIGIYASNLPATLATSLALSECRPLATPRPAATVAALAVKDAVFDWSVIASTRPPTMAPSSPELLEHDRENDVLDIETLYALRAQLFREPAAAFDAFASPMLFFRTTGRAIPGTFPVWRDRHGLLRSEDGNGDRNGMGMYVARKSHLTFPPMRSGLRIPATRIAVTGEGKRDGGVEGRKKGRGKGKKGDEGKKGDGEGETVSKDVLREQAEEMVKLMRRSVILHEGKERRANGIDRVAEAEMRIALVELGGLSGQNGHDDDDDGKWAVEFFEEVLGNG